MWEQGMPYKSTFTTTPTFTPGDVKYLLSLVEHDIAEKKKRYAKPEQIAKREQLMANGKRDAAIWAIEQCERLADTLSDMMDK
jgi:hypothetical protein